MRIFKWQFVLVASFWKLRTWGHLVLGREWFFVRKVVDFFIFTYFLLIFYLLDRKMSRRRFTWTLLCKENMLLYSGWQSLYVLVYKLTYYTSQFGTNKLTFTPYIIYVWSWIYLKWVLLEYFNLNWCIDKNIFVLLK